MPPPSALQRAMDAVLSTRTKTDAYTGATFAPKWFDTLPTEAKTETKPMTNATPAAPAAPAQPENIQQIAAMLATLMASQKGTDETAVRKIAGEVMAAGLGPIAAKVEEIAAIAADKPQRVVVRNETTKTETDMGLQHKLFPTLVKLLACRAGGDPLNIWMTGPAGSGKTTAARNAAKALELPFYFNGAIDNEYKLLGFTDAQGRIVSRPFREVWSNGGLYLFDEVDASVPGALLAFNAALANGRCDFPDGCVERHKDCVIIAAANTFGQGATADYVGRVKQDAAFLDRFVQLSWEIDEKLERALCANTDWVNRVQKYRKKAKELGLRVIISPRASMFGAAMIEGGFSVDEAEAMAIRKGMTDEQWKSLSR